jgi:ABC-type multidrug transport system ATPase subunit
VCISYSGIRQLKSDVRTQRDECYAKLGFCPQFDGLLDVLTGREHLLMYAQLKGIAADAQEALVEVRCRII